MNLELATEKLKRYCAYQERSHLDVTEKLYKLGLYKNEVDEVITRLLQDDFLNEQRFAEAYVSGKFKIKKWGKVKIISNLKQKRISDYCIKKGLLEIDEEAYQETLSYWIERKKVEVKEEDAFKKKGKIAAFLIQKGFESGLVWEYLNSME
ncbi:MAG: regulatory protein RecX [Flavobacteriales bacterium]